MSRSEELYYWEGEKPPPLVINYEDEDGDLITTITGAALVAKTKIDTEDEADVTMTNNDDGTMTIDWPTGTSAFTVPTGNRAAMRIDIQVTQGSNVWYIQRFTIPIRKRA
jgi:hypothetical protein